MNEFEGAIHTCNSNSFMKGYEELKSYKIEMCDKKEAMEQI